ncbi:MAG TPA: arsenate reductase ArsC [Thermodesulfovibrionales bacterium]|nr:arsenate reductase ArsC [Thermodesulfovibrionales bacterium]
MDKKKVLFVCVHNSARSQMAEAFLNAMGGDKVVAESAGLEPGVLNPIVVDVMKEVGFDISNNKTQGAFDCFKAGKLYHYVITVCDETNAERCPIFPGLAKRLHWGFDDPSKLQGSREEKLQGTRIIRDQIKAKREEWISQQQ